LEIDTIDVAVAGDLRQYRVDVSLIISLAVRVLEFLGAPHYELSIQFSDQMGMQALNTKFRNKEASTDVLSFPQQEFPKPLTTSGLHKENVSPNGGKAPETLGDIVLSLEDADQNAKSIGHTLDREVGFLIVHGLLHLCGHDHLNSNEERLMILEQKKLMSFLNPSKGKPLWANCVGKR
jgi:probable rRNA maturation factor